MPTFCIVIPARYSSTRFPGKPLADIGGKTMIRRVWEAASSVKLAAGIIIATDDERIFSHAKEYADVILTSDKHPSGTDRSYEAFVKSKINAEVIVNIQGDEPFIKPEQVNQLVELFNDPEVQIATLKKALFDASEIDNPNVVKVVTGKNKKALYFSRSRIPYMRDPSNADSADKPGEGIQYFKHIGMYAYRADVLKEITNLPISDLERTEKLEQLRWLENGYHIAVGETKWQSPAVDTPADLTKANEYLKMRS